MLRQAKPPSKGTSEASLTVPIRASFLEETRVIEWTDKGLAAALTSHFSSSNFTLNTHGNHRSEFKEGKSETSPYILLIGTPRKSHVDRLKYNYIRKMVHDSSEVMLAADTLPDFLRQQLNKSSMDVTDICSCQLMTPTTDYHYK